MKVMREGGNYNKMGEIKEYIERIREKGRGENEEDIEESNKKSEKEKENLR